MDFSAWTEHGVWREVADCFRKIEDIEDQAV